jgi:hypothetical protein
MPKDDKSSLTEKQQKSSIERPLTGGFAPYALTGEQLMMIPLMPDHRYKLYTEIFSQPQIMQYFG